MLVLALNQRRDSTLLVLRRTSVTTALVVLAVVALWFLQRPYVGIAHDGVLYLGQALNRLYPGQLSADLFFAYGSQDRFTLMTSGYAWLIGALGAPNASLFITLLGQLAFIAAAAWCVRAWLPWALLPYALVTLGAARFYGGWLTLSYSEPFVTARLLGEPLVLVAIGLLARARPLAALIPLGLAAVVHPLVALAGAAVYGVAMLLRWPWLALPAGLALACLGGALWVEWPPLAPVFARFDDAWWLVIIDRNEMVFPGLWEAKVWAVALACAWLLAYALATQFRASTDANRTLLAVWTAGVAGVLAAFVGADVFRLVLVTQLQLWRWLWPLQLLAMAVLPLVFVALWQARHLQPQRLLGLALVVTAIAANPWPGALAAIPVGAALMLWRAPEGSFSPQGRGALLGLALLTVICGVASAAIFAFDAELLAAYKHWRPFNALLWLSPVVAPLLLWLVHRAIASARWSWLGYASVAVLVSTVAVSWDSRGDFQLDQEAALTAPASSFGDLPPDAIVLWQPNPLLAWMVLQRPNYYTNLQGAGLLFNRGTALEWDRRRGQIATKKLTQTRCFEGMVEDDDGACRWNGTQLLRACSIPGGPTHVVSPSRIAAYPSRDWELRHAVDHPKSLHLYQCAEVRARKEFP
ncbi:MAG TPA: hypothetical protein PLN55_09000 [Burkholderiaceae bacterium]|nr:hypothetical protein [Burkholderiaceae bacterium]